jgi:hypothetical protein
MPKRSGHETHRLVRCLGQFALESLVFAGMEADVTSAMLTANAASLTRELTWFEEVLQCRIHLHFGQPSRYACIEDIAAPELSADDSEYAQLVRRGVLGTNERLVLLLALIPHVRPEMLDLLFVRNTNLDRGFTEFGGWKGKTHGGFLPTHETAAFLLAGHDLVKRFEVSQLFEETHFFHREGILRREAAESGEPFFSSCLTLTADGLHLLTSGDRLKPDFSREFPASRIETVLDWNDLVVGSEVRAEIENINTWAGHAHTILAEWGLGRSIRRGYRSLFYGPPGTGKTLTATLIGKGANMDVYRIDLSMMVSKFIGETEKNLANVFDQAENKNWVLFFDEADALFGKRTATSSSNDRHANQQVSYLLQRIEDFPGIVILATNMKNNIDDAFARRFQSMVHFRMPDADQRKCLWQGVLRDKQRLADDVDLDLLAEAYELSGGAIANVVRYGAISALQRGEQRIAAIDLRHGVAKELRKEGKMVTN